MAIKDYKAYVKKNYANKDEHEKGFNDVMDAIKDKDIKKISKTHTSARKHSVNYLTDKIEKLQGEEDFDTDTGIDALAEAVITYDTKRGLIKEGHDAVHRKEHKHLYKTKVEGMLKEISRKMAEEKGGDPGDYYYDLLSFENINQTLDQILGAEHHQYRSSFITDKIREKIPATKDESYIRGMSHYWATLRPHQKYSVGDLAKMMPTRDALIQYLVSDWEKSRNKANADKFKPKKKDE